MWKMPTFLLKHGIKKKVKRNGTREPRAPGGGRQEAPAPRSSARIADGFFLMTPGFNDFI